MHAFLRETLPSFGTGLLLVVLFNAPLAYLIWRGSQLRRQYRRSGLSPLTELPVRPPGESLRAKIDGLVESQQSEILWLLGAAVVGILLTTTGPDEWRLPLFGFATGIVAATGLWTGPKILRTTRQLWECRLAFDGERSVGEELNQLMCCGYHVFHDLPCERYNIDHVLAGPSGVFAVETKTRASSAPPGKSQEPRVRFDGEKLSWPHFSDSGPVDQALFNARSLSHWLSCATGTTVRVQPVVAVPGWTVQGGADRPEVWVLNPKEIRRVIADAAQTAIDPPLLEQISRALAERSGCVRRL